MIDNYQARLVFPSDFHEYTFKESDFNKDQLVDFCYLQKKLHPEGLHRSNNGGWHSPIFKLEDQNPISSHIEKGLSNSVFTTLEKYIAVKVEYWIMINNPNSYNIAHTHPNSDLSGVFWIKTPEESGKLKFVNPSCFQAYLEINSYVSKFTSDTNVHEAYIYTPKEGMIITFPSHTLHEVEQNKSEEDRIAVSYNITLANCFPEDDE